MFKLGSTVYVRIYGDLIAGYVVDIESDRSQLRLSRNITTFMGNDATTIWVDNEDILTEKDVYHG